MDTVTVDTINEAKKELLLKIEYNGGGIDSLLGNALLNAGSMVKSVQRGFTKKSLNSNEETILATINEVNIEKSILICNSSISASTVQMINFYLKDSRTIAVHCTLGVNGCGYAWQVIEFY